MSKIKFTKEDRKNAVRDIQIYFQNERDEEIGNLPAELLLDFFLDKIGPVIYNKAIEDAHQLLVQKAEELFSLQKTR